MKKLLICLVALTAAVCSYGQAPPGKGGRQLNAGFGLSGWGVPVYAGLDFGVHQDITIGPEASFRSYTETYFDSNGNRYTYVHTILVLAFTGNYHFNTLLEISPEWNLYAGLTLGYYIWSSPSGYLGTRETAIGLDGQIGGRYFVSQNFGINLEVGGGTVSGGKLGITYRF